MAERKFYTVDSKGRLIPILFTDTLATLIKKSWMTSEAQLAGKALVTDGLGGYTFVDSSGVTWKWMPTYTAVGGESFIDLTDIAKENSERINISGFEYNKPNNITVDYTGGDEGKTRINFVGFTLFAGEQINCQYTI